MHQSSIIITTKVRVGHILDHLLQILLLVHLVLVLAVFLLLLFLILLITEEQLVCLVRLSSEDTVSHFHFLFL